MVLWGEMQAPCGEVNCVFLSCGELQCVWGIYNEHIIILSYNLKGIFYSCSIGF